MAISKELMTETFQEMGIPVENDGVDFVHTTQGNHAPLLHSVVTLDEDGGGATLITALGGEIDPGKRMAVFELLNLIHGQSLWNVRFHMDENGRVFSVGKHMLWGKPFNAVQFGDIFFSLLVTTDRLYPCLAAIVEENAKPAEAFDRFFNVPQPD